MWMVVLMGRVVDGIFDYCVDFDFCFCGYVVFVGGL